MTRKTYRTLAVRYGRLLAINGKSGESESWEMIRATCDALKEDNSAFDRDRFFDAIKTERDRVQKAWDDSTMQALTDVIVQGNG